MENENFSELIQFLGKQFDNLDKRFENVDKQFENVDKQFQDIRNNFAAKEDLKKQAEEYLHQNRIISEDLQHKMELLAEGFKMHDEKNERDKAEIMEAISKLDRDNMHVQAELYGLSKRVKTMEEGH